MAVSKRPAKPRTKTSSALRATSASKAKVSRPAPAPSAPTTGKYSPGDMISHVMFGHGVVTAIDSDKLTIEFESKGVKQIVDSFVKPRKD